MSQARLIDGFVRKLIADRAQEFVPVVCTNGRGAQSVRVTPTGLTV
jgi:hypothetical protein